MIHLYPYLGKSPSIDPTCFLAPGVCLFGDVRLAKNVSMWCHAVARGDVNFIDIGQNTNIQDLCCLHVTEETPLKIGQGVTVGHHVMLHGCTIGDRALIGMGSIILDNAVIGEESLVGAGSLVTERTVIPPGSLVMGSPAKVKRALTPEERKRLNFGSEAYMMYAGNYLQQTADFPRHPWK